jgi:hypothetical protein
MEEKIRNRSELSAAKNIMSCQRILRCGVSNTSNFFVFLFAFKVSHPRCNSFPAINWQVKTKNAKQQQQQQQQQQ